MLSKSNYIRFVATLSGLLLFLISFQNCSVLNSNKPLLGNILQGEPTPHSTLPPDAIPPVLRRRALIIGLDGTTGNQFNYQVFSQNKAPNLKDMLLKGRFTICESDRDTRCARTHSGPRFHSDYQWKTGPGWAAVLTGVDTQLHKVKDNSDSSLKAFTVSTREHPTLFGRAKKVGLKTAAAGVGSFITSRNNDSLYYGVIDYECGFQALGPDVQFYAESSCNLDHRKSFNNADPNRDNFLTEWMLSKIDDSSIDITMGVYDVIDTVGHSNGFDSNDNYLQAITDTDTQIGHLLNAIRLRAPLHNEEWLVLLTSDHGGHRIALWGDHGDTLFEDEVVPFAIALYGSEKKLKPLIYPVTHMDTNPTIMHWLNIPPINVDGRIQGF
ncbi:MAG: alkaline phosphatase family protein [Bdellovibrionota bacterium]